MARYSAVPWLADSDLRPCVDPETIVEGHEEIARGLWIRDPFGRQTDTVLTVHAYRDGRILVSEAQTTDVLTCEVEIAQSNPRREAEDDGG